MSQTEQTSRLDDLVARFIPFLEEIKDMTAGDATERWLNAKYGVDSEWYADVAARIAQGVKDGWLAHAEVAGPRYRRAQLAPPSAETNFFSITAILLDSTENSQNNAEGSFRGGYHLHPYGEINLAVPLNDGAALAGPDGWRHGGWTAPAPGSEHFPEVKGGAVLSLTFLPAGRIAFGVTHHRSV